MLAIRLPPEIERRLADLAKASGRTKTFYALEAIKRHLDKLEASHAESAHLNVRAFKGVHPEP